METYGKCPKCEKGELIQGTIGYLCNYCKSLEDKCDLTIWKEIFGKKIIPDIVVQFCTEKKTKILRGFKTKTGEPLERKLILLPDFRIETI